MLLGSSAASPGLGEGDRFVDSARKPHGCCVGGVHGCTEFRLEHSADPRDIFLCRLEGILSGDENHDAGTAMAKSDKTSEPYEVVTVEAEERDAVEKRWP